MRWFAPSLFHHSLTQKENTKNVVWERTGISCSEEHPQLHYSKLRVMERLSGYGRNGMLVCSAEVRWEASFYLEEPG